MFLSTMKQIITFLLIFLFQTKIEPSLTLSLKDMEKICLNSDEYINNFFSGDEELPEKYNELDQTEIEKGNDENIIKLILLSENSEVEYENTKTSKQKKNIIILLILIIPFCIVVIIFEIHFICRNSYSDKENRKKNVVTFSTFIKINPFGLFKYLCIDEEERIKYFIEYKTQNNLYYKYPFIFFSILIFILIIGSIFLGILNYLDSNKTNITVNNMTCALMKFLYELKNKPIRQSSFLGFENVSSFFINFNENSDIIKLNSEILTNNYKKCKTQNTSWTSSIDEIQKKLSDQESMEFYFYGLPSDPNSMNFSNFSVIGDISKANKNLFQLQVIYDYYPVDTKGTILYDINQFFINISEPIISEVDKLERKLSSQESNNKEIENNNIYQNIVSKFDSVLDLYIKIFKKVYLEQIDNNLKDDLIDVNNLDLVLILILSLCIPLFYIFILNINKKKCYSHSKTFSFLLMQFIFILFIASVYQLAIFKRINKKIIYIQDIWRGIAFLFDSNNINYLNENPINNTGDVDLLIKDNNKYNNLFYYLNYMVNNKGKLGNSSEILICPFNKEELSTANKTFNDLNNILDLYDSNNPNEYLYNYNLKISDMIKGGLKYDTGFQDISGTGYLGSNYEDPLTYLTYVNVRTRANTRKNSNWGIKDFDCDETWNISTSNHLLWFSNFAYKLYYYTNSEKYLCDSCINHYSSKNSTISPLLNFLDFSLEQIIDRYSDLNNTEYISEFNGLVYYFTAVEFLRNSSFIQHLQKMYNFNIELNEIQKIYFATLQIIVDATKEIINRYLKILSPIGEVGDISSSIYCTFLRKDLNFVLGEIKNGFLKKINHINKFHMIMNIINIILSILMIIFYCMISYNLPYFQIKNDKTQKNKQQDRSISKILTKNKKNYCSLDFRYKKDNQTVSDTPKNKTKIQNIRPVFIKITGNTINNNTFHREGIENNNSNSPINNNSNFKVFENCLKNEQDKKKFLIQKDKLNDVDDANVQSKDYIIGDLQNDVSLKLNENKNN